VLDLGINLPEDRLRLIHETALRILAEIGIRTDHAGITEQLAGRGCRVEGERVFIAPDVVKETIKSIPPSFFIYGRSVEKCLKINLEETHGINTGIFANIYDIKSGKIRRSTLEDVKNTTRLLDAMQNVHAVYVSLVDATDIASHMVTVADFAATISNTTKPLIGPGVTNRAEAEIIVALASAIRHHDREELRKYPPCIPFVCPITPLYFPKNIVDALIVVARAGLPLNALTNPVMGLTSPYTLASTVTLGHAEIMALAVMAHTITPALPIVNQNTPSVADMKTLVSTTGGPETALIRQMAMLLSRYLNIPCCAHGHTSSVYQITF
jgi:trimethylamine--corrinoid protein Co-methyltransferase